MIDRIRGILQLPAAAYAPRSMPKRFFERNFELTAAERKFLNIPFLPIKATWLAELNHKTINASAFTNETYTYTRIPVFVVELGPEHYLIHRDKLCRLYHKYIPFQVLLYVHAQEQYCISAATKSINQSDKDKRVLEQEYATPDISLLLKDDNETQFGERLAFHTLDRINLKAVYDSYIAAIVNYNRAVKTGNFQVRNEVGTVHKNLTELEQIEKESATLKNKLQKTKDIREKVDLQMALRKLMEKKSDLEDIL